MVNYYLCLPSFFQKGLEAKSCIDRVFWMEGDSHSWEKIFQGKENGSCCQIPRGCPVAENSSGKSVPLCDSCFRSFFPSSAAECTESASGPSFFFFSSPFLSFLIFSHSPWQLQGGGGRRMAAAAYMYGTL